MYKMHKRAFVIAICGQFTIWIAIISVIFGTILISQTDARSISNKNVLPIPARKSSSAPGMIFGNPELQDGSPGQSVLLQELMEDEEFMRDFILKRVRRNAANDKADRDYEEDNEEEEEQEALKAEQKEESDALKEQEAAAKKKKDAAKKAADAEKSKNVSTAPTSTEKSQVSNPTTVQGQSLTVATSATPSTSTTENVPIAAPQTGTTTSTAKPLEVSPTRQIGNSTSAPQSLPRPPQGPPGQMQNITMGFRTITLANGTKIRQQFKLPPGTILGKPPPGAGGRPPLPGMKPGFQIPPHLLLGQNTTPKPKATNGELYLPEDYNRLEIPKLDAGKIFGIKVDKLSPVPVLVFLNIRSIRDIDETNGEIVLDMDMKVEWVDGVLFNPLDALRGKHSKPITLNPVFLKKIWQPDIYIDELIRVRKVSLMAKPETVLFSPGTGLVSDTFRVIVRLSCEMDFYYYPADTHRCEFHLKSYSYFNADLNLSWLRNGAYLQDPSDPNFDLAVDSIETVQIKQVFNEKNNDTYDGLAFTVLARRKLSFHMVQTYLPSVFFIIITWLCFLVPARMVEARIGISMTTLLTLTAMFSSVRESTPIVSYVKAIDIWMVFCIFFVFLTLLEFSLLVWIRSFREDAEEKKNEHQRQMQEKRRSQQQRNKNNRERSPSPTLSVRSADLKKYELLAEFTEKWAFLIFSLVFLVFNVIYWTWLLTFSDYFDWNVNSTHNALLED